jgi:hypothetical protein
MKALDLTGYRRGRLVGLEKVASRPGETVWRWRCDCGAEPEIAVRNVRQGKTRSCGCLLIEKRGAASVRHGHTQGGDSPTYRSWNAARSRCFNPKNNRYPLYGGRGIGMCEAWRSNFDAFLADMGERPAGKTLDRVDTNADYGPDNCKWSTPREQALNRRAYRPGRRPGRVPLRSTVSS